MSADDAAALTTVVVPNYNHASYLPVSLDAILGQRDAAPNVIFIDDASTDESVRIAEPLLAGRRRARLVRHAQNRGIVSSLNEGLALVDTPFVAFAGADDRLATDFVARAQRALLEMPEAALAAGQTNIIDGSGRYRGHRPVFPPAFRSRFIPPREVRRLLGACDNFLVGNVTLYRTDRLRALGGFDPGLGAFCDGMAMRLLAARHGFCYLNRTLGNWRLHGDNYSTAALASPDDIERTIAAAHAFIERIDRDGALPTDYATLLSRRILFGAQRAAFAMRAYRLPTDAAGLRPGMSAVRAVNVLPGSALRGIGVTVCLYLRHRPYRFSALLRFLAKRLQPSRRMLSGRL